MNANKQAKVKIVKEIVNKLQIAKSLVIANYEKTSVKQFEELRSRLREKEVEIKVYKNRLFRIAAKQTGLEKLEDSLTGLNVFAFGIKDDIWPAKIIANFSKEFKVLEIKSGIFEGKVVDATEMNKIASLPTFEEALAKLAMQLISPIKYVSIGLNELSKKDNHSEIITSFNQTKTESVKK